MDPTETYTSDSEGPPARNLRKNSGRQLTGENNMARVSDKLKNKQKQKKGLTDLGTPSVKRYFEKDLDYEQSEETINGEYGGWTDAEQSVHVPPQEDWTDLESEVDGDESESDVLPRDTSDSEDGDKLNATIRKKKQEEVPEEGVKLSTEEMIELMYEMVTKLKSDSDSKTRELLKQGKQIKQLEDKVLLLTKVIKHQDKRIENVDQKTIAIEQRSMKDNLIFTGIEEMKNEVCIEVMKKFFKDNMQITETIKMKVAHRIGKGVNRAMVVRLSKQADKGLIFKHFKNIKNKVNGEGKPYNIRNQLPEKLNEQQRDLSNKVKINKGLIDAQQQDLKWKKGQLVVNGEPYKCKVIEPSNRQLLSMKQEQIRDVLRKQLFQGQKLSRDNSHFLGFATKTHSIEEVVKAYQQLKYRFADADHIMCSYRILDPDVAHMQDSLDGGEFGAGRRLLQLLIDQGQNNVAVFVVRHHLGPNIGPARFELITQAAENALKSMPPGIERMVNQKNFSLFSNPVGQPPMRTQTIHRGRSPRTPQLVRGSRGSRPTSGLNRVNMSARRTIDV